MIMETNYQKALRLVGKYHKDQKYGDVSYAVGHLYPGSMISLRMFNFTWVNDEIRAAYLLHDILEDTECTYEELVSEVGYYIADIVQAVTDEPGENRKERKQKTYAKMKNTNILIRRPVLYVKLLDRYMNTSSGKKNDMYRKEQPEFEEWFYDEEDEDLTKMFEAIRKNLNK